MKLLKKGGLQRRIQLMSLWIVLPLLAVALVLHAYVSGPLQKSYRQANNQQIAGVVDNINQQLSQLEISLSVWGQSYENRFSEQITADTAYQTLNQISEELFYLANSSNYVSNVRIYSLGKNPFGLESGGTFQLSEKQQKKALKDFKIADNKLYRWQIAENGQLDFVQNIDTNNPDTPLVYLVATLDAKSMLKYFNATQVPNSGVGIAFDKETIVTAGDSALRTYLKENTPADGSWVERINGEEYSVMARENARLNQTWTFYSLVPLKAVTGPITHLANVLLILSTIFITGVLVLSLYLAGKQYQPIQQTMDRLFGDDNWQAEDELQFLVDRWNQMDQEKDKLERQTLRLQDSAKRQVMQQLVEGYYGYLQEAELRQHLTQKGWDVNYQGYRILFIQVNELITPQQAVQEDHYTFFAIENIVNDLTSMYFADGTILAFDQMQITLVAMMDDLEYQEFVTALTKQINSVIRRHLTIVISPLENQFRLMPDLVEETQRLITHQHLLLENQVLVEEPRDKQLPKYPLTQEKLMITALKSSYQEELYNSTAAFIKQALVKNDRQYAVLFVINRLYDQVEYELSESGIVSSEYLGKTVLLERIQRILNPEQVTDFLFQHFLKPVSLLWQEKVSNSFNETIQEVANYMQKEFTNEQMSLEYVADQFELDPIFLSKEFKRVKHVTFIDYLTNIRIAEAKRLLVETNQQISSIAESMGYNPSYFNRLFKKVTGMTPGQYRKGRG